MKLNKLSDKNALYVFVLSGAMFLLAGCSKSNDSCNSGCSTNIWNNIIVPGASKSDCEKEIDSLKTVIGKLDSANAALQEQLDSCANSKKSVKKTSRKKPGNRVYVAPKPAQEKPVVVVPGSPKHQEPKPVVKNPKDEWIVTEVIVKCIDNQR